MSVKKRTSGQMSLRTVAWSFFHEREPWKRGFSATILLAPDGCRYWGAVIKGERGLCRRRSASQLLYASLENHHPVDRHVFPQLREPALGVDSTAPLTSPPFEHVEGSVSQEPTRDKKQSRSLDPSRARIFKWGLALTTSLEASRNRQHLRLGDFEPHGNAKKPMGHLDGRDKSNGADDGDHGRLQHEAIPHPDRRVNPNCTGTQGSRVPKDSFPQRLFVVGICTSPADRKSCGRSP